jgi:TolA-binding protein
LHTAASSGYKDFVELFLAKGADVNAKNEDGYTPLHRAAEQGEKDVAELLLAKGADVNAKNKSGSTPLSMAANRGNKDVAELLLAKGADVNAINNYWWTPLHKAADSGRKDIAELLLSKGADINAKNNHGNTPLQTAASSGQTDIVDLLKAYTLTHDRRNPRELLKHLTDQLKDSPDDKVTRSYLIKLAGDLKPALTIPEEARKHFVEGAAIVKAAKNPAQQALAAQSFTEALKVAPWWGDAYYNLGVAQELAEKYDEAEQAFNFYLLSNPSETEKREVQDRIYALSAKRKLSGAK